MRPSLCLKGVFLTISHCLKYISRPKALDLSIEKKVDNMPCFRRDAKFHLHVGYISIGLGLYVGNYVGLCIVYACIYNSPCFM